MVSSGQKYPAKEKIVNKYMLELSYTFLGAGQVSYHNFEETDIATAKLRAKELSARKKKEVSSVRAKLYRLVWEE